ncbi:MAG TPA: NAD-dependent epimerase/dehydratase family protein, partial [Marmoricola sp.]|nr:NAD-dependent epimerase/dehydratase family protein [Marmoricola sp.]
MSRTAVIAGATGLVGRRLLDTLLADGTWDEVVSVGRREVDLAHRRLEQRIVDFAALDALTPCTDI